MRVNYEELKERYGEVEQTAQTDEAVKKLNMLTVNGAEKEPPSPSKKSIASSISNFFRKMSPRLNRKSRAGSERSSASSSNLDEDDLSQTSGQSSPAHKSRNKSPLASPIRRLMNHSGKKSKASDTRQETVIRVTTAPEVGPPKAPDHQLTATSPTRSVPPQTLNVQGLSKPAKRGLLTAMSTDSIGDCSLDVNMTGSEPSIASGPQSTSVSKRTLLSSDNPVPALKSGQPASFSEPEISAIANGAHSTDMPEGKKISYLGLSVSVGGYPKYRAYKDKPTAVNTNNSAEDDVFYPTKTSDTKAVKAPKGDGAKVNGTGAAVTVIEETVTSSGDAGGIKDGQYFLSVTEAESVKILQQIRKAEADLRTAGKSEEVYGKLRSAIGKANLLVSQKFQQFKGLCEANLHPSPDTSLVTTCEDLAGFWDMVSLQVEDVYCLFSELQQMKDNGWKEIVPPPPVYRSLSSSSQKADHHQSPNPKSKPAKKPAGTSTPRSKAKMAAEKSREEARRRLMEAKKAARRKRLASGGSADDVEIFIAEPEPKH